MGTGLDLWETDFDLGCGNRLGFNCVNTLGSPLPLLPSLLSSCILCGPSRQWPGTSLHIGVGGVLGHPPGAITHSGNRLGSPLCEPPWISIV